MELVLHAKRFEYTRNARRKKASPIAVSRELDLGAIVENSVARSSARCRSQSAQLARSSSIGLNGASPRKAPGLRANTLGPTLCTTGQC